MAPVAQVSTLSGTVVTPTGPAGGLSMGESTAPEVVDSGMPPAFILSPENSFKEAALFVEDLQEGTLLHAAKRKRDEAEEPSVKRLALMCCCTTYIPIHRR